MKRFLSPLAILLMLAACTLPMVACAPAEEEPPAEDAVEEMGEEMEEGMEEMGEEMEEGAEEMMDEDEEPMEGEPDPGVDQ